VNLWKEAIIDGRTRNSHTLSHSLRVDEITIAEDKLGIEDVFEAEILASVSISCPSGNEVPEGTYALVCHSTCR
jgi:hypothetical protein